MEKHNINFTKLVETLRWNGKEYKGSIMDEDDKKLLCDAADAIERLQADLDKKNRTIKVLAKKVGQLIDIVNEENHDDANRTD